MKVDAIIEMPRGTFVKYEIKKGFLFVDRLLDKSVPYNYGFINGTLAPDGDPLDIFLLDWAQLQSHSICSVKILGAFKCLDNGVKDDKLIGYIAEDKYTVSKLEEIKQYLETYKKGFKVIKYVGRAEAERIYRKSKEAF